MSGGAVALALAILSGAGEARAFYLGLGDCELAQDPESAEGEKNLLLNACARAVAGSEIMFVSGAPKENAWLAYGSAAGGIFLTPWLSVQARGVVRDVKPLGEDVEADRDRHSDYAVVQLGNPVLNKVRVTAGHIRLPFGIDETQAPQFYQLKENRDFWASPETTAYLTLDDLRSVRVDIGAAGKSVKRGASATDPVDAGSDKEDHAGSVRVMYDVSALEGTRIVASGSGSEAGQRRYGAGLINVNRHDDYTAIEFVRLLTTPDGKVAPFEQLIRVAYASAWHGGTRWVAQIDDERLRSRRGMLDHDIQLGTTHAVLRLSVGYYKSETGDGIRRWSFTTGLEAHL